MSECSACGLFQEFKVYRSYIQVFNPFEFIFVYGARVCSNFILQHVAVQFSQHHLLKRLSFLHFICILATFIIDQVTINAWVYLWTFYPVPLIYISVFVPVPYCLMTIAFQKSLKSGSLISPDLFFFLKIALAIHGLLYFHTNCNVFCSNSVKKKIGNLIRIALNLQISLDTQPFSEY